ncbi:uncharacterized protein VTP21DRAFT_2415 [Calcarisporiella thermophila]|uniref:uncharacterized protein n=1 Tax=Calcarisporiella thermophila TaxID=911321 RepID=UPI003742A97D
MLLCSSFYFILVLLFSPLIQCQDPAPKQLMVPSIYASTQANAASALIYEALFAKPRPPLSQIAPRLRGAILAAIFTLRQADMRIGKGAEKGWSSGMNAALVEVQAAERAVEAVRFALSSYQD